jgi:hypothetical protein
MFIDHLDFGNRPTDILVDVRATEYARQLTKGTVLES